MLKITSHSETLNVSDLYLLPKSFGDVPHFDKSQF